MADESTTTTTTAAPLTSDQVKLDNAPTATTQAGVQETSSASAVFVGDDLASNVVSKTTNDTVQTQEENIESAKAQAFHNHAVEHANDPTPTSGDKTAV